ncbi:MAG: hypothetical protein AAB454_02385 [Patescibacteria group bacterium]
MIYGILQNVFVVLALSWWILLPLALFFIFWQMWLTHVYIQYLRSQKWVLLNIKIPENIEKTPKAMEQVFAAVYQIYSFGLRPKQMYWEGKLREDFISFEIVGTAGGVYFQIRTQTQYRNILESAIYAQYPDAEIAEGFDHTTLFPKTLPNKIYDFFGADYHLVKEDGYPIRTYEYFEESVKEKRLDPIASITEVMSKLKEGEMLWIQVMVRPTDNAWQKKGEELRDKLAGRKKAKKPRGILAKLGEWVKNFARAPVGLPEWMSEEKPVKENTLMLLTPGEKEVLEAVEEKISKLGFETNIRFLFIDRRDSFSPLNISATMSTFNQFNTSNMNSFRPNLDTITLAVGISNPIWRTLVLSIPFLKKRFVWYRKRRMWESFKKLYWPRKKSVLNIEELATVYHFPAIMVSAPLLRRVATRKGEPPAGLPTE